MIKDILQAVILGPTILALPATDKSAKEIKPALDPQKAETMQTAPVQACVMRQDSLAALLFAQANRHKQTIVQKRILSKAFLCLKKAHSFESCADSSRIRQRLELGLRHALNFDQLAEAQWFKLRLQELQELSPDQVLMLAELYYRQQDYAAFKGLLNSLKVKDLKTQDRIAAFWRVWGKHA